MVCSEAKRKKEAVLRLLKGEELDALSPELGHAELSWAIDSWASRRLGVAGSARLHEAKVEALRQLERDVESSRHSEEVVVRAGLPSREAARTLWGGLAEVVRRPALA